MNYELVFGDEEEPASDAVAFSGFSGFAACSDLLDPALADEEPLLSVKAAELVFRESVQ